MFEYLHVRGFLNSGGFGNKEEYYPMVPEHVVQLCRWFNNAKQQDTKKEILVWNDHLHRVDWLKWYWDERERNRARKFVERDELMMEIVQDKILRAREVKKEAEREEELMIIAGLDESDKDEDEAEKRELDDIMDLDLSSEGSEEGEIKEKDIHMGNGNQREQTNANIKEYEPSQWQERVINGRGGENGIHMGNGNQNGYRNGNQSGDHNGDQNGHQKVNQNGNQNGRPRLKRKASDEDSRWGTVPVNPEGKEDPDGLTQKDWELTMNIEASLEIKEGASMEEVVRETVLWALDVHETGQMWKRQQADENKDDVPTHRRIRDVMQI